MSAKRQEAIFECGSEILDRADRHERRWDVWDQTWVVDRLMRWSMRDERLKVRLFRFVDVLPSLTSAEAVVRHMEEYLGGNEDWAPPEAIRIPVRVSRWAPALSAWVARQSVGAMARRFVLARDARSAIPKLRRARRQGLGFTLDILGEAVVSAREADEYFRRYQELLDTIYRAAGAWSHDARIDDSATGPTPRVNVSVKVSALAAQIQPADPEGAIDEIKRRLRPLMMMAQRQGSLINLDMESYALKALTFRLFTELLEEPELRDYAHAGIVVQAYLRDSGADLDRLIAWARARGRMITVRLVKGAYWDYETIVARQKGWPVPVWQRKAETDANYERLARRMLESGDVIHCAFGTHNVRSIAAAAVDAARFRLPRAAYEIQMLYGMADGIKKALVEMGFRVREYCPIGELLPGMSYLVRRLLENTSNEGFLRARATGSLSHRELLRDPAVEPPGGEEISSVSFRNEPPADFTGMMNREKMRAAIATERARFGETCALCIGGKSPDGRELIESVNPANPDEVVGRFARGTIADAEAAVGVAREAWAGWRRTPVEERAALLERVADALAGERFPLAALEVLEVGKPWMEADADVAEAIDFCRYYAQEMRRLGAGERTERVPGEISIADYVPRGVCAVIAPWNFPLAILTGMTAAAVVAGNTVVMKPAEQSTMIASRLMRAWERAGAPAGVVNLLTGVGEEVGAHLIGHAGVDVIAFTGSKEVGLKIWAAAGRTAPGQVHLKKAICEMGGKNGMIVDADADMDEAVTGALHSAFGYAGQKCSALSRLIVLEKIHDRFVERLIEGARALRVGDPALPGTTIGPLIDRAAFDRVRNYCDIGESEARLAYRGAVPEGNGYFVAPHIFVDVPSRARIAQEEIFGPVLAVMKARDLDEAIEIMNGTEFALTAGIYSRSPANIESARRRLEAGNIYINRPITGAIVGRHPFGGWKMSGGGTKAGGREYLENFLLPRVVTENTMRRGFSSGEGE
jgi:RHH-type proline utilization regulon transcriptional repressor/proline dehydrogenase/delta 1-pyrroline-5-carboxylate dehydrogenase